MKARRTVFIYSKKLSYIQPIRMIFVGFNLCQRIFFNKVVGTVHVHPLKLNIYTFVLIPFKPFAFSKLNVTGKLGMIF